jgi:hypothetical protein
MPAAQGGWAVNAAASTNWLQRTHQRWKVAVFGLAVAIACSLWIVSYTMARRGYPIWLHFAGAMAMGASFLWFGSAVRCRACGKSVATSALASISAEAWFPSLSRLQRCPVCGDEGTN